MPKKIGNVTKQDLVAVALPAATKTYTVISHKYIIDNAIALLNQSGFYVEKELYRSTHGSQVATGLFKLNYGGDTDLSLMFAFGNSYDKTMKFRSAIGAYVNQNDTVMINKFNDWDRKHTGNADQEALDTMSAQVASAASYFDELKMHKDLMCNKNDIERNHFAAIVGQLYFNKFITVDQISCILKEYDNPSFTYTLPNTNLWTCYNHILVAMKRTHPKNWIENQIAVHLHICDQFDLLAYDDEQTDSNDDIETQAEDQNNFVDLPGFESEAQEDVVDNQEVSTIEETTNLDIEEEVEENSMHAEEKEEYYFDQNDYTGVDVGDYIEEGDVYYEIVKTQELDGLTYWICNEADALSTEEDIEEVNDSVEDLPSHNDDVKVELIDMNVNKEEEIKDTEVEDISLQDEDTEEQNHIKTAIAEELEFIYAMDNPVFTYTLNNDLFMITLNTGETCTLSAGHIMKKVEV